jgi:Ca2+-binding RTX toxin-like protein
MPTITGTGGNDRLTGSAFSNDTISGLGGNDILIGLDGRDGLDGGDGNDLLYGDSDPSGPADIGDVDNLLGGAGDDSLHGGVGDDILTGGAGDDLLDGGAGSDRADYRDATTGVTIDLNRQGVVQYTGGGGSDTLVSIEQVQGTRYADLLIGDGSDNMLGGSVGTDDEGGDQLYGNGGADWLTIYPQFTGPAASFIASGGAGNDYILYQGIERYSDTALLDGGSGDDRITALGLGLGMIAAGTGSDRVQIDVSGGTYHVSLGDDTDTDTLILYQNPFAARAESSIVIADFTTGAGGDTIVLSGLALANYVAGSNPFSDGHLRLTQSGADTLLQVDRNGGGDGYVTLLTLLDTRLADFTAANLEGYALTSPGTASTGTAGADSLSGGSADDVLTGLDGNDILDGGDGQDILYGDQPGTTGPGGNDILNGGAGGDLLVGGHGDDQLNGGAGNDQIYADVATGGFVSGTEAYANGDPLSVAGSGNDVIDGGTGFDTAYLSFVGRAAATVDISAPATISTILVGGVVAGSITAIERLWAQGGDGADRFTGGAYADMLIGGAGNDILRGGGRDDILQGGAGNDRIEGGTGIDTARYDDATAGVTVDLAIQGTAQNTGGSGNDTLLAIENLDGSAFADLLSGDANANVLTDRLGGYDRLYGKDGADTLTVERSGAVAPSDVTLSGGADNDVISFTGAGRYTDAATLDGGDGDDVISASGLGAGSIEAGAGDDRIVIDTLGGQYGIALGTGSDTLVLAGTAGDFHAASAIYVSDFATGAGGDTIDLTEWLLGDALTHYIGGTNPFLDGHFTLLQSGGDTLFQVDRDGGGDDYVTLLTFANTSAAAFTAANLGGLTPGAIPVVASVGGTSVVEGNSGTTEAVFTVTLDQASNQNVTIAYATAGNGSAIAGTDYVATSGTLTIPAGATNGTINVAVIGDLLNDSGESFTLVLSSPVGATFAGGTATISATATIVDDEILLVGLHDVFTGTSAAEGIYGLGGNDIIDGGGGDDRLVGGYGDDLLIGGPGNDALDGEDGIDTASYATAPGAVTVDLALTAPQDTGSAGFDSLFRIENLTGSGFGDILRGNVFANVLRGGAGNDSLDGGDSDDVLVGGAGDDLLAGSYGADTASYDDAVAGVTVSLAISGWQDTGGAGSDMISQIERLTGSAHDDHLTGDAGDNILSGGDGDDVLNGGAGDNVLIGGVGIDIVSFAGAASGVRASLARSDVQTATHASHDQFVGIEGIEGSSFGDLLTGSSGDDVIYGRDGNDTITAGGGNDVLIGGAGSDRLSGGDGDDVLEGGLGNNIIDGGDGFDLVTYAGATGGVRASLGLTTMQVTGGSGRDQYIGIEALEGSGFGDLLTGSDGDDIIYGRDGNDTITAGAGNDLLIGDAGSDRLTGGAGTDSMTGGARGDQFIFLAASDSAVGAGDIITDFHHGEKDRIDLNGIFGGAANFIGSDAFTGHAGEIRYALAGSDLLLSGDVDGNGIADFEIHLLGISTIGASDFIL